MQSLRLRIRSRLDDGREAEVLPLSFQPLGLDDLQRMHADPKAEVEFRFKGKDPRIAGELQATGADCRLVVSFEKSPSPFALVAGGWLPIPFVLPQRFLVDRNVVSTLRRIRTTGARQRDETFSWWTQYFEGGGGMFNPLLYAYEGAKRRTPERNEFVASFEDGVAELEHAFPKATVIQFRAEHFDVAYEQLLALKGRGERDTRFLLAVAPRLHSRVSKGKEAPIRDFILETAREIKAQRGAPVMLAALSVLYEDVHGGIPSIGRRVIKPTPGYSLEDAYNAVSDLRHLELAALSNAVLPDGQFALCTADQALAEFWCALKMRGSSTEDAVLNVHYQIDHALTPRLSVEEEAELIHILRSDA